mgnify:CR=1 FL=1
MSYYTTYRESVDTDESTHNSVMALNGDENPSSLQIILENCRLLNIDADLYDEAGFAKGWVKQDGDYRLT